MDRRFIKDQLYEQVARIGKAASSPKRLELLGLLAQGEKSVEALAQELDIGIKLVSAHLRALRQAHLVTTRKEGTFVHYRLASPQVAGLWVALRECAQAQLVELQQALDSLATVPDKLAQIGRQQLLEQVQRGEIVLLDVRPLLEFQAGHLPYARSIPLAELGQRLAELPRDKEIVAYCRGPFCLFAQEAAQWLAARRYRVSKLSDGVAEWHAAGLPVTTD